MFDDFYEEQFKELDKQEEQEEVGDLDSISLFMDDIQEYHLLSAEEEQALGKRIAEGDRAARNELCDANYRLVIKNAKKFTSSGMDLEDLIQAGNMGLMRAADKFDYTLGYRFSTYATSWIQQFIRRSIADNGKTIRVPVHMNEAVAKQSKAITDLTQELGRTPTISEIAAATDVTEDRVQELFNVNKNFISLDMPIGEDEESDLYSVIEDTEAQSPEDYAVSQSLKDEIRLALSSLSDRERDILILRNGLDGGEACTLEEIAQTYGVTRERVRQIEAGALRKLRHSAYAPRLKEYLAA